MNYCENYVFVGKLSHSFGFLHELPTKEYQGQSPFFESQAKYLRLELVTSQLSRRT